MLFYIKQQGVKKNFFCVNPFLTLFLTPCFLCLQNKGQHGAVQQLNVFQL